MPATGQDSYRKETEPAPLQREHIRAAAHIMPAVQRGRPGAFPRSVAGPVAAALALPAQHLFCTCACFYAARASAAQSAGHCKHLLVDLSTCSCQCRCSSCSAALLRLAWVALLQAVLPRLLVLLSASGMLASWPACPLRLHTDLPACLSTRLCVCA